MPIRGLEFIGDGGAAEGITFMKRENRLGGQTRVSVVIPVFNSEKHIGAAIDSALGQSYRNLEVIVVDDGSTDGTSKILESYGNKIRMIRQHNLGASLARNRGIEDSAGCYVAFLDADDLWMEDKIAKQIAILEKFPDVALVCSRETLIDEQGLIIPMQDSSNVSRDIYETPINLYQYILNIGNIITLSSVVVRRRILDRWGKFDEALRRVMDYDLWIRISENELIYMTCEPLVKYRLVRGSITRKSIDKEYMGELAVIEKHNNRFTPPQLNLRFSKLYHDYAVELLNGNKIWPSIGKATISLRYNPLNVAALSLIPKAILKKVVYPFIRSRKRKYAESEYESE